jgi:hypothetical protein
MRALKVFGGQMHAPGLAQVRTIVAASSKKQAAELLGVSLSEVSSWWSVTGNPAELFALTQPGVVFQATSSLGDDFAPRTKRRNG